MLTGGNSALARAHGGRGQPLDPETRADMEAQFGADFSSVQVHTDESAAATTRANDARALTTGSDIYFEPAAYAPRTRSGRALLAHELAHVVQQSQPRRTAGAVSSDTLEREAQQAAATPALAFVTPGAAPFGSVQLAEKGAPPVITTTSIAPKREMKPPPAVIEARKLQQRAQQLQERLPPDDAERTVCSGRNGDYISGHSPRPGFEHVRVEDVDRQAGRIGHGPVAGGYNDPTRTGEGFDVHAEVKHGTAEQGVPKGAGRKMCESCQDFHHKQAIATGKTETVGDPEMVREFKPNGDTIKWYHDGRVDTEVRGGASATPKPEVTPKQLTVTAPPTPPTTAGSAVEESALVSKGPAAAPVAPGATAASAAPEQTMRSEAARQTSVAVAAPGEAIGAGILLTFQGVSFAVNVINDKAQAQLLTEALALVESDVAADRRADPSLGILLLIYYTRVVPNQESLMVPGNKLRRVDWALGRTPAEAEEELATSDAIRPEPGPDTLTIIQRQWIPPRQP